MPGVISLAVTYKNSSPNIPGAPAGQKKIKSKRRETSKRQSMLNTNRMAPFKYDMNEILSSSSMDASVASSFLASIVAKASRVSTKEAKEFAKTFVDSGALSKEEYDRICRLMDRYSKFR